jgi:hypothetical protein
MITNLKIIIKAKLKRARYSQSKQTVKIQNPISLYMNKQAYKYKLLMKLNKVFSKMPKNHHHPQIISMNSISINKVKNKQIANLYNLNFKHWIKYKLYFLRHNTKLISILLSLPGENKIVNLYMIIRKIKRVLQVNCQPTCRMKQIYLLILNYFLWSKVILRKLKWEDRWFS